MVVRYPKTVSRSSVSSIPPLSCYVLHYSVIRVAYHSQIKQSWSLKLRPGLVRFVEIAFSFLVSKEQNLFLILYHTVEAVSV